VAFPLKPWLRFSKDSTSSRHPTQSSVSEILCVLPCRSVASADWTRVFPAVRDNSYTRGISFIHDVRIAEPRAIIGWQQVTDLRFILCTLCHCSSLQCGSYRVSLLVDKVIQLDPEDIEAMCQVLQEYALMREA